MVETYRFKAVWQSDADPTPSLCHTTPTETVILINLGQTSGCLEDETAHLYTF